MKNSLAVLTFVAVLVFVAGSAFAGVITVDGLITDWETASLLHDDPDGDAPGGFDIRRYGATVIEGVFYAVIEIDRPVSEYDGGLVFPGSWINADQLDGDDYQLSGLPATELYGTDVNLEWGRGNAEGTGADPDFNFWGRDDDVGNYVLGGVPGGAHADSGSAAMGVFEWSAPVSSIVTALAGLPDNVDSDFPWTVMFAGEGSVGGWGRDYAGPITVVPEPGTLALLACGLISLLCYAWRKRK